MKTIDNIYIDSCIIIDIYFSHINRNETEKELGYLEYYNSSNKFFSITAIEEVMSKAIKRKLHDIYKEEWHLVRSYKKFSKTEDYSHIFSQINLLIKLINGSEKYNFVENYDVTTISKNYKDSKDSWHAMIAETNDLKMLSNDKELNLKFNKQKDQ